MSGAPVPRVFITHAFTGTTVNTTEHITLTFPIEHDGLPIKEIALRRPTVGDHLTAQKACRHRCRTQNPADRQSGRTAASGDPPARHEGLRPTPNPKNLFKTGGLNNEVHIAKR